MESEQVEDLCEASDAAAECDARFDSAAQYPTKDQLSAVLSAVNSGMMSCHAIAHKLNMSIEDVAGAALLLLESNLITCDDVEAPE